MCAVVGSGALRKSQGSHLGVLSGETPWRVKLSSVNQAMTIDSRREGCHMHLLLDLLFGGGCAPQAMSRESEHGWGCPRGKEARRQKHEYNVHNIVETSSKMSINGRNPHSRLVSMLGRPALIDRLLRVPSSGFMNLEC